MKRPILGIFIATLVLAPVAGLEAQDYRPSETRSRMEAQRAEMEARREAIRKEAEARREEARRAIEGRRVDVEARAQVATATRTQKQTANTKRWLENAGRVLPALTDRLTRIADRIQSRIEKIDTLGGDTAEAKEHLAMARADIAKAKEKVSTFDSIDISGDSAQDNFQEVRSAAAEAREFIRSAHRHLMLSVRSLAGVRREARSGADDEGN